MGARYAKLGFREFSGGAGNGLAVWVGISQGLTRIDPLCGNCLSSPYLGACGYELSGLTPSIIQFLIYEAVTWLV